jgi:hypothetical protein
MNYRELIPYILFVTFVIYTQWNTKPDLSAEVARYEARTLTMKLELDNLRHFADSVEARMDSIAMTIEPTTEIIQQNETTFKSRSSAIRVLAPNQQVEHLSTWLSEADSLLR